MLTTTHNNHHASQNQDHPQAGPTKVPAKG